MSIMMKDILELEIFKNHILLAGNDGLTNLVDKVGIIDHETEDMIIGSYDKGEFVISTFFIIKDEVKRLYGYVEKLIQANTSGLAIKDFYFNNIPQDVIDLANKNSYPIFIFNEVFYEDIITSIVSAIKDKECTKSMGLKIDDILSGNLNTTTIKKLAYKINKNFEDKHVVVFCKNNVDSNGITGILHYLQRFKPFNKLNSIIPYNNGFLIIYTFKQINEVHIKRVVLDRLNDIGFNSNDFNIGISSLYQELDQLYFSISESLYAFKYSLTSENRLVYFNKIGTSKILIPVLDNLWVKKYYNEMLNPIIEYDKKNDTSLLKTAVKYVENNGDIKATSKDMFQHSNTIRYRINKLNKVLNQNHHIENFYEELSIAIRLYKLLKYD